jgi:hypothetical protein
MTQEVPEVNAYPVAEQKDASLPPPPGSAVVTGLVVAPAGSAVAIPAGNNDVPMRQQAKVGAKCCGCFCDYRRALIVVALIGIAISVISLIMSLKAISDASSTVSSYVTDDYPYTNVEQQFQDTVDDVARVMIITTIVGVLASVCALVGALWFNIWLVVVNVIWLAGKSSPHEEEENSATWMFSYSEAQFFVPAVNFILAIRFT